MADTMELEVATPERLVIKDQVSEMQIPARDGYVGILPGHAPLVTELSTGFMSYVSGGRKRHLSIHGGFMEVLGDHVRVLADAAERAEEIDVERARKALQRAQEQLMNPSLGVDPAVALGAVERARARLEAAAQQ